MRTGFPLLAAAAMALSSPAQALPSGAKAVGLGFEGIGEPGTIVIERDPDTGDPTVVVDGLLGVAMSDYYAGGSTKSLVSGAPVNPTLYGPTPGNFGITFTDGVAHGLVSAIATPLRGTGQFGPRWKDLDPSPDPAPLTQLGLNALFVQGTAWIHVNGGFNDYLSFWYSNSVLGGNPSVEIFAEDKSTKVGGDALVATLSTGCLSNTYPENQACRWAMRGKDGDQQSAIALSGGIGHWVRITAPQGVYVDNLTFGSDAPLDGVALVPEPGTYAMLALGLAAIGVTVRRRG